MIELLAEHDVPGMSYVMLKSCQVDTIGHAGLASVEDKTMVHSNTVFEAASLSKPVFAWLVIALAEEGVIDLDQTFAEADFDYPRITDIDRYNKLTPRQVLIHRTGLPNWVGDSGDPDRSDQLEFVNEPGSSHSYSGEAYLLLQSFIEEKTGKSLQSIFEQKLGSIMGNSTFSKALPTSAAVSRGYYQPVAERSEAVASFSHENAAYSLVTTASDFGRFMELACSGEGLTTDSHKDMLRIQTSDPYSAGSQTSWRLGWQALMVRGGDSAFHSGDNGNYQAMALFFLDNGEGSAVFTNAEGGIAFINAFLREMKIRERQ
ncbi:MAG: serine hydrolase domain-containing protein [Pseudomonadota bacterium]